MSNIRVHRTLAGFFGTSAGGSPPVWKVLSEFQSCRVVEFLFYHEGRSFLASAFSSSSEVTEFLIYILLLYYLSQSYKFYLCLQV